MLREKIDLMISEAIKNKEKENTEVLRSIKNEFLVYKTGKNAKPMTDEVEVSILKKMVKQRLDSRDQYLQGKREDLAMKEENEAKFIEKFLPKEATENDIKDEILKICIEKDWVKNIEGTEYSKEPVIPKKSMGEVIKLVKSNLSNVDGKLVSEIVKKYLEC